MKITTKYNLYLLCNNMLLPASYMFRPKMAIIKPDDSLSWPQHVPILTALC